MTLDENELLRDDNDDAGSLDWDAEDESPLLTGIPNTLAEKRRAQKVLFEAFLKTEAALVPTQRRKTDYSEEKDVEISIQSLMAQNQSAEIVKNPREYQLELFERAKHENTIAVLDTGSGKTLIAVLLIRWIIDQELESRAAGNQPKITFFLVPSVTLVFQQHAVLETNLDHNIAAFCGASSTESWLKATWDRHFSENRVIVCTADILLHCLARGFITIRQINLLVFDEAHHTKKNHAYARIIKDYYLMEPDGNLRPRVFGMTASPVDSKSDVTQAAFELESLLHSRIATATDLSFQQALKNRKEEVLQYGPLKRPFETEFLAAIKARYAHIGVFQKLFNTAKDVAAELGPWCAGQYLVDALAEKKLPKYEALVERGFYASSVSRSRADLDRDLAEVRNASEFVRERWKLHPDSAHNKDDLSVKVQDLAKYLNKAFERPSNHRCLVFVNERHVARLLAKVFQRMNIVHLRAGFLTGSGKGDTANQTFTFRQQVVTMMQFRNGDLNCLFVTSVAEEGLDVPDCNLVIRFSLYNTMVQYVQSRGRARQQNSKFVHMVENGNSIEMELVHDVRFKEMEMRSICKLMPEDRLLFGNEDAIEQILSKEKGLRTYVEPTTGAKLTYGNALGFLANFVSQVPTDADEPQHPTYAVTSSGSKFIAEVLLPTGAPIRSAIGLVCTRKTLAKRSAAFEACIELRRKGFLDDRLQPIYVKRLPAMRNAELAVNTKKTLVYDMKTKPLIWQQTRGNIPGELFITIIDFPEGLEHEHEPVAMLTRTPMPQFPQFPIILNDGRETPVVAQSLSSPLVLSDDTLSLLSQFTFRVFKDVFSKTYEDNPAQLSYWLAPVDKQQYTVGTSPSSVLNWTLMKLVSENEEYKWSADMPEEELVHRFIVDQWDGGRKFYSTGVSKTLKPLDPVPEGSAKSKWKGTILNYSNSMFKSTREKFKDTWDTTQPVMETEKIVTRRNMLASPVPKELKDSTQAFLCPQPLRISVLPPSVAASCFTWPAVIWRFESYLIALEAADMVGVECGAAMALAAITKDSDNSGDHEAEQRINFQHGMGNNYERLEFMGDCFLKTATSISTFIQNPNDNEFEFHVRRMLMLCNKNLFDVAKTLKLYEYIRSRAFSRRLWYPEGLKLLVGKGAQKTEETEEEQRVGSKHNLGEKTIADVCEALIGAAFMSHDKPGQWQPSQWDNAVSVVTKLVGSDDHTMLKWDDYSSAYEIPAYQTAESTASQRDTAEKVEKEHDYHFQYPRLLRSAFIHPSQPYLYEKLPNYQRLEFLGDALLDMASITYIFNKFPDKDPQWLTEHKMAMIGNRALGMIAVNTGFYKHIRHNHAAVEQQIRDFATELNEAKVAAGPDSKDYWTSISEPPKCLGDIVEAYVGAVFIDSNFNYNEVQRFFDLHIQPYFEDMSLYDSYANNHPCTHLHHLLDQTYGCQGYRIMAREVPAVDGLGKKEVVVAVIIHNDIVAHDRGKSARYARVRVAKMALEQLEGLAPYEFRSKYQCQCAKVEDGDAAGVRADCGI
ncbi:hypothetical protein Q7P37_006938 [Cladosporium fusiforme]